MKPSILVLLLAAALVSFVGCASPSRDGAHGREQELRKQLAQSVPMKKYGYTIKDLRFAPDNKKVLVVFTHPDHEEVADNSRRRPDWEFVLTLDEFGRYRGSSTQPFYTPGTASTPPVTITATFPKH